MRVYCGIRLRRFIFQHRFWRLDARSGSYGRMQRSGGLTRIALSSRDRRRADILPRKLGAEELRPRGIMLSYPVITSDPEYAHMGSFENLLGEAYDTLADKVSVEKQVTEKMPPCFIWHTLDDDTVPVENSLMFTKALHGKGISAELHIFPEGVHGLSLASPVVEREDGSGVQSECARWIELADAWLERLFE